MSVLLHLTFEMHKLNFSVGLKQGSKKLREMSQELNKCNQNLLRATVTPYCTNKGVSLLVSNVFV